jgi:hypothetical protein
MNPEMQVSREVISVLCSSLQILISILKDSWGSGTEIKAQGSPKEGNV